MNQKTFVSPAMSSKENAYVVKNADSHHLTAPVRKTHHERILEYLSDGQWHSSQELAHPSVCGWKFATRISELINKKGYHIEKRPKGRFEEYRLESPQTLKTAPKIVFIPKVVSREQRLFSLPKRRMC